MVESPATLSRNVSLCLDSVATDRVPQHGQGPVVASYEGSWWPWGASGNSPPTPTRPKWGFLRPRASPAFGSQKSGGTAGCWAGAGGTGPNPLHPLGGKRRWQPLPYPHPPSSPPSLLTPSTPSPTVFCTVQTPLKQVSAPSRRRAERRRYLRQVNPSEAAEAGGGRARRRPRPCGGRWPARGAGRPAGRGGEGSTVTFLPPPRLPASFPGPGPPPPALRGAAASCPGLAGDGGAETGWAR